MVPEKQDSPTISQCAEPCSLPGGQPQKGGWGTGCYRERNEDSSFLPGHSVCVCTTLIFGVFFLPLKQELISILKMPCALPRSLAVAEPGRGPGCEPRQCCPLPCRPPGQRRHTA